MFVLLLAVTFVIAFIVSAIVVKLFDRPIDSILNRLIADDISRGWLKYLRFAMYVVGISSGVRVWHLEKYITADKTDKMIVDRWILEVYRTVIGTLQGIAWLLLVFFVFALVAYVIVRIFEFKAGGQA